MDYVEEECRACEPNMKGKSSAYLVRPNRIHPGFLKLSVSFEVAQRGQPCVVLWESDPILSTAC